MTNLNTNEKNLEQALTKIFKDAKLASIELANASTEAKNSALNFAADELLKNSDEIIKANQIDVLAAQKSGMNNAFIDRLTLNETRVSAMAQGLREVAFLADPVGKVLTSWSRPNGLNISKVAVPLGVIGIIFESRPNVTADAGALCLKSGNASILRGGSDSINSCRAILACLQSGLARAGITKNAIQMIPVTDRAAVGIMLNASEYIDVIVPRGGKSLISRVINESKIPLFQHLDGNCHTYIHTDADLKMSVDVVLNAKMRRTGVCGATESLVVDQAIASSHLPKIVDSLIAKGCEIRGDAASQKIDARITPATDEDYKTEYLDSIISVKIVSDISEAILFIRQNHSSHTDSIITANADAAEKFLNEVDSAIVMHNASTQFADGGEFGMGAEIGIATGKMHARGPVGVEQLCTFKYKVRANGATRN